MPGVGSRPLTPSPKVSTQPNPPVYVFSNTVWVPPDAKNKLVISLYCVPVGPSVDETPILPSITGPSVISNVCLVRTPPLKVPFAELNSPSTKNKPLATCPLKSLDSKDKSSVNKSRVPSVCCLVMVYVKGTLLRWLITPTLRSALLITTWVSNVTSAGSVRSPVAFEEVGPFIFTPISCSNLFKLSSFLTVSIYISFAVISARRAMTEDIYANISTNI